MSAALNGNNEHIVYTYSFFLAAPSACGGAGGSPTTAAPTPAPTTAAPTPAPASCTGNLNWIGDNYCDDELNNAACEFDKGDCCNNSKPGWDNYCNVSTVF